MLGSVFVLASCNQTAPHPSVFSTLSDASPAATDAALLDAPTAARDAALLDASPAATDAVPSDRAPVMRPPPGLAFLDYWDFSALAHSREIAIDGDLVYIADANGLPIVRMGPGSSVVHSITPGREQHCSTVSMHPRSHTLVCAAGDSGILDLIDVSNPAAPRSRPWSLNDNGRSGREPIYEIPDVEVSGDTVWMAAHRDGLLRVTLGADGMPTELVRTGRGANVTGVDSGGGRLALIDRTLGLVMLSERDLAPIGSASLDGPPLDVAMEGDHVAVALGSEGARVFHLIDGAPSLSASVQPRCVATGVALSGDLLAVACLSGVTLYNLTSSPPRVAGFAPARFGMLDVAFTPRGLLATDWYGLAGFTPDAAGRVEVPETPHAMRLMPGAEARILVRNPGAEPLSVAWRVQHLFDSPISQGVLELPPSGDAVLTIPAAPLEAALSRDYQADVVFLPPGTAPVTNTVLGRTHIAHRASTDQPARGVIALGDRFPTLRRTVQSPAPDTMLVAGMATHVMFLSVDCFLQWPQLEDMAWSLSHGRLQAVPTVFYLTTADEDPFDPRVVMATHAAADLMTVEWADYARSVLGQEGETNPVRAFEQSFYMRLPGADHPHDYLISADGVVIDTQRMYRGRWDLLP